MNQPDSQTVSILVPVLNESASLPALCGQLLQMLDRSGIVGEVIIIDDGSVDETWSTVGRLAQEHPRVRGIRLQRNFGKASALAAGINASCHDFIATIDGDLQDDPDEIPAMLEMLRGPTDLVSGWKRDRQDPWHRRLASRIFNGLVSLLTGVRLHDHNCGLKTGRRAVYESLRLYGGMHRFIPVLAASNGFRVSEKVVTHRAREHGRSRYGLGRIPRGLLDLITVCFLTVHRQRIQAALLVAGSLSFLGGLAGMAWMAVYWVLRMSHVVEGPPVHERPIVWYALGALLAGLQILVMSFLAELLIQRTGGTADSWLVAAETGPAGHAAAKRKKTGSQPA